MGKVKQWLMEMEEDAADMTREEFLKKHTGHEDVWDRVNNPNFEEEDESWY
tara:strand:+ start:236 stop:388 length:153 start_codon:yes stop_codon:yes gene_type:complete